MIPIKNILYITNKSDKNITNIFDEVGISYKEINLHKSRVYKNSYYNKREIAFILTHITKGTLVFIDDYLNDKQIISLTKNLFSVVISRNDITNTNVLLDLVKDKYKKAILNESKRVLTASIHTINTCNNALVYLDSYDNILLDNILGIFNNHKLSYKYKYTNEFQEVYPLFEKRLPRLIDTGITKYSFIKHNILPVNNEYFAKSLFEYAPLIRENKHYNSEYLYFIRISDLKNENFVENLKLNIPALATARDLLQSTHLNIIFIAETFEDHLFFRDNQELFGSKLFEESSPELQSFLGLAIFDATGGYNDIYPNIITYLDHVLLDNTEEINIKINRTQFRMLEPIIDLCRVSSNVLVNDDYLINLHCRKELSPILMRFEDFNDEIY